MSGYRFETVWRIPHPRERVWQALNTPEEHHLWWWSMREYELLTPGQTGVGSRARRAVRGRLPYTLRYITTVTKSEPPVELAYDSAGDLIGHGRFVLTPIDEGTQVVFDWQVSTSKRWMNALAPLLRWLFAWNHNWVMHDGERGLTRWLAGR